MKPLDDFINDAIREQRSRAIREFCDRAGIVASVEAKCLPDDVRQFRAASTVDAERVSGAAKVSDEARRAAQSACFDDCRSGRHLDPENGAVSICHRAGECQGWRAYLSDVEKADE